MGKKTKPPKVIDSEGKQGNFFLVAAITVGEGAMGAAAELGANTEKMTLEKI